MNPALSGKESEGKDDAHKHTCLTATNVALGSFYNKRSCENNKKMLSYRSCKPGKIYM